MSAASLLLVVALTLPADPSEANAETEADAARQNESAERVLRIARKYEFYGDSARRLKYEFHEKPLLTYSNPVRGEVFGNVFVWTRKGRPEVLGAIFDFRSEHGMDSELHVLANGETVGVRDGTPFLSPARAGVEFVPVPQADRPAA